MQNDSSTFTKFGCEFNSNHFYQPKMVAEKSKDYLTLGVLDLGVTIFSTTSIAALMQAYIYCTPGDKAGIVFNSVVGIGTSYLAYKGGEASYTAESSIEAHLDAMHFTFDALVCRACDILPDYMC